MCSDAHSITLKLESTINICLSIKKIINGIHHKLLNIDKIFQMSWFFSQQSLFFIITIISSKHKILLKLTAIWNFSLEFVFYDFSCKITISLQTFDCILDIIIIYLMIPNEFVKEFVWPEKVEWLVYMYLDLDCLWGFRFHTLTP